MNEIRLLTADEIEVKIKQVGEKGAVALLYKTARTDMAILDETFGPSNWTNDYKEIKGNLYCGIGIRMADSGQYVWRWDCGIESRADEEGNEKKGEASDAFKRAGTRWGIGRELYTAPFIFLSLPTKPAGKDVKGRVRYALENKFSQFSVKKIGYDEKRRINLLVISDENGRIVYSFPKKSTENGAQPAKSGTEAAKAAPEGRQATEPKKPAEAPKITFERACEMTFIKGDRKYKLGELSNEWLVKALKNDTYLALHPYIEVILDRREQDAAEEEERDIPFDV